MKNEVEDIGRKFCVQCNCVYYDEYCPICNTNTEGKKNVIHNRKKIKCTNRGGFLALFSGFIVLLVVLTCIYVKFDNTYINNNTGSSAIENLVFKGTEIAYPDNGTTTYTTADEHLIGVDLKNELKEALYIKFKDINTLKTKFSAFVYPNSTTTISAPAGIYKIYYACGSKWYGEVDYFGPSTNYYISQTEFELVKFENAIGNYFLKIYESSLSISDTNHTNKSTFNE